MATYRQELRLQSHAARPSVRLPLRALTSVTYVTLGNTAIGATTEVVHGATYEQYSLVTAASTGAVKTVYLYLSSGTGNEVIGIYDNSGIGGAPGALLAYTAQFAAAGPGWNSAPLNITLSLTAAHDYYFGWITDSGTAKEAYDASGFLLYNLNGDMVLDDPAPAGMSNAGARYYSIYAGA